MCHKWNGVITGQCNILWDLYKLMHPVWKSSSPYGNENNIKIYFFDVTNIKSV